MTRFQHCTARLRLAAGLALCAASAGTPAQPANDERGFSYFMGLGAQRITYRELPRTVPVKSEATVTNPLLITGAVYALHADALMSLDSESTFAPGTVTERWTATVPVINNVTLTDRVVQTNRFSLSESTTRLLLHYRVFDKWFGVAGPSFHSQSFKRFGFATSADNVVTLPADRTVDESASEVLLHAGLALESESVRNRGHHYSVRATIGRPVWRRLENTAFPSAKFSGTGGYELSLAGRYSLAVLPNVHLGLWGQALHSQRSSEVSGNVELPKSSLRSLSAGIELLWKL
jgi:hypothetical protein